jgi:hypothetical protein
VKRRAPSVALDGTTLRIRMEPALPSDPSVLAVAVALRLLARYPVVDRVVLGDHPTEVGFTREQIERLLQPEGFAALDISGGWSDILARTMRRLASPEDV